jgi:hypothetical protein
MSHMVDSLDSLLKCEHESVATYTLQRHGTPLEVCTDCGARREPKSSRPEWIQPAFLQSLREFLKSGDAACRDGTCDCDLTPLVPCQHGISGRGCNVCFP